MSWKRVRHDNRFERQPSQRGSALVIVLLVMLLVSTVALSLVVVTEIGMELGGTERVLTNNKYIAESGTQAALAAILVTQDWGGEHLAILDGAVGTRRLGHRATTSRVQAVGPPQMPPLTIANEGQNDFHTFSVVLTTVAQRVSWPANEPSPIYEDGDARENDVTIYSHTAQSVHYFLSPIRTPATAESPYNSSEITKVSY